MHCWLLLGRIIVSSMSTAPTVCMLGKSKYFLFIYEITRLAGKTCYIIYFKIHGE